MGRGPSVAGASGSRPGGALIFGALSPETAGGFGPAAKLPGAGRSGPFGPGAGGFRFIGADKSVPGFSVPGFAIGGGNWSRADLSPVEPAFGTLSGSARVDGSFLSPIGPGRG